MKTLRSLLMALALLMMFAIPAMAQEFSGTVSVDCFGDPETVTVTNTGTTPFIVDSVTSLDDPRDNESFDVSVELEAGESVVFETGGAAGDGALTNQFIFDNEDADEGVEVLINTEGQGATANVTCEEGSGSFGGAPSPGPIVEPKIPDNQQDDDDTVTKTFELTLHGTVPAEDVFGLSYHTHPGGDPDAEGGFGIIIFCGQAPEGLPVTEQVSDEDCEGNDTVYSTEVELSAGDGIHYFFARAQETDPADAEPEIFFTSDDGDDTHEREDYEVISSDMTNTAWYTFDKDTGAGDEQETPDNQQDDAQDDQQGEIPGEMPDTGAGGLTLGATIPVGNAAAGLTMFAGAGYAVLRRR